MNKSLMTSLAVVFAATSMSAFAQTTTDDAKKKADFAKREAAMQNASKSSASGSATVDKNAKGSGAAPTGVAQEQAMQKASKSSASGSAPVDPKAKAADPRKAASKMTAEEKKKLLDKAQKASTQ